MSREFRIFAEIPDGKGGIIHEEIDHVVYDSYPDEVDTKYFISLALDLYPDCVFVQVYELAEEIKVSRNKHK